MSKEFKGTPGPWSQLSEEVDKSYIRIRGATPGCRYKIANVLTPEYAGKCIPPIQNIMNDTTRANAKLIAAAPELLDALRQLRDYVEDYYWQNGEESLVEINHPMILARRVINKALGEE
jgi:hypothetical protein